MAYGVTASSLLIAFGFPPAATSATVHAAECFTTGASAISHHAFDNIDRVLFKRLLIPGIAGAVLGAWVCRHYPVKKLMVLVGLLVVVLSLRTLLKVFGAL